MPNKQQKRERDRQDVVLFFELIQIAIGNRAHFRFHPITFSGITRLLSLPNNRLLELLLLA